MIDRIGEGLIKCPDCGAMVPSFASLIDQPGAPEHMTLCFRPVHDATMHNPGCTYCHDPETVGYLRPLIERFDRNEQERNKLTVGELLDSISPILNLSITAEDLMKVAEIGKVLFYDAICTADEQDNAGFFAEAYSHWGPVVDDVLAECDRDITRDTKTGRLRALE